LLAKINDHFVIFIRNSQPHYLTASNSTCCKTTWFFC